MSNLDKLPENLVDLMGYMMLAPSIRFHGQPIQTMVVCIEGDPLANFVQGCLDGAALAETPAKSALDPEEFPNWLVVTREDFRDHSVGMKRGKKLYEQFFLHDTTSKEISIAQWSALNCLCYGILLLVGFVSYMQNDAHKLPSYVFQTYMEAQIVCLLMLPVTGVIFLVYGLWDGIGLRTWRDEKKFKRISFPVRFIKCFLFVVLLMTLLTPHRMLRVGKWILDGCHTVQLHN